MTFEAAIHFSLSGSRGSLHRPLGSLLLIDKFGADETAFAPDQPTFLRCSKTIVRYCEVDWKQWKTDMQAHADAAMGNISYGQLEEIV